MLDLSEPKEEAATLWNYGGRYKNSPNLGSEKFLLGPMVVREATLVGGGLGGLSWNLRGLCWWMDLVNSSAGTS